MMLSNCTAGNKQVPGKDTGQVSVLLLQVQTISEFKTYYI